jgi:hypothetical protein
MILLQGSDLDLLLPGFTLEGSVADPDPVGFGPFWSDPAPDPGLNKSPYIKFFGVCKSHKYFRITINILLKAYFGQKKYLKKFVRKFISVRIRIWTFSKVGYGSGSGQKSSGSATLVEGYLALQ